MKISIFFKKIIFSVAKKKLFKTISFWTFFFVHFENFAKNFFFITEKIMQNFVLDVISVVSNFKNYISLTIKFFSYFLKSNFKS